MWVIRFCHACASTTALPRRAGGLVGSVAMATAPARCTAAKTRCWSRHATSACQGLAKWNVAPAARAALQRQRHGKGALRGDGATGRLEKVRHRIETPHPAELPVTAEQLFDGAIEDHAHALLLLRRVE